MSNKTLKLGILICGHVNPALHSKFNDYHFMFERLLQRVDGNFKIQYFNVVEGEFPDGIDAYIASGSQFCVNDDLPWIKQLEIFICELYQAKKCFIGICFGHQLLAKALGGRVEKSEHGWGIGVHTSQFKQIKIVNTLAQDSMNLVVSHQDQVVKLPIDSRVLSTSEFCPYSMIQVGENFIGLQGHPEFTRQYSSALMDLRKDLIPGETIDAGRESLTKEIDSNEITQWLINFMSEKTSRS